MESITNKRVLGRASGSNRVGRFEAHSREAFDDGWEIEEDLPVLRTEVSEETPRSIISRNSSPDLFFDRSINPYRGCEHGCIYCFARPTHAFLGWSPGLDFETKLVARPQAPEVLERELRAKSYSPKVIAFGTNTDPYQPIERQYRLMRRMLKLLLEYRHPVSIVTKGTLIERDLDVLEELAKLNLVHVGVSVTTLDPFIARKMEPRVPGPKRRLQMIERLAGAGVPVRVMAAPMVPALTDHELEAILKAGKRAGAVSASWIMLRLPLEVSELFQEWLREHFPDRAERVMGRVRSLHGGQDYDPDWASRMSGRGPFAQLMQHRFDVATKKLGLDGQVPRLRRDLFQKPVRKGDQLSLF